MPCVHREKRSAAIYVLISVLDGSGLSTDRPGHFTPRQEPQYTFEEAVSLVTPQISLFEYKLTEQNRY
jgi:hypothetical protein